MGIVMRDIRADFIKVIATLMVIMIHTVAISVISLDPSDTNWQWANYLDSFCRVAPPLFFMISGSFLLSKREPIGLFFSKRASKLIFPILFWSAVYFALRHYYGHYNPTPTQLFNDFMMGNIYYHLWFLNSIVIIYILTPFIRIISTSQNKYLEPAFVLSIFFASWAGSYLSLLPQYISNQLSYIGYFTIGHMLWSRLEQGNRGVAVFATVIYILTSIVTASLTSIYSLSKGEFEGVMYGYATINIAISSIALFIALLQIRSIKYGQSTLGNISSVGLGIYLAHPILISLFGLDKPSANYPIDAVIGCGVVFLVTFLAMKTLAQNPIANKIT